MHVSFESSDKLDISTLSIDYTEGEFRTIEASLHLVSHRTTANETLRILQQTQGRREGIRSMARDCEEVRTKNMSDNNSAYAALINTISERDQAKDVKQFDGILRTFVDETSKIENTLGKIRDEEKDARSPEIDACEPVELQIPWNYGVVRRTSHCCI